MLKIIREAILISAFFLAIIYAVNIFSEKTLPYRDGYGCLWRQYLLEEKNTADIMFFGSSLAYCNAVPSVIYDETGYSSFVMAGPQLTIKQTYYYMKEAFKTQSPKLVFLETSAMFFSEFTDYTRINISYMPYSENRVMASLFAAEGAERLGCLFPPYNYHELWADYFNEKKKEELKKEYKIDLLAGYTFLKDTVAQDKNRDRSLTDYSKKTYDGNLKTLIKIADLCEKNEAQLILYSTPMYKPLNPEYYQYLERDTKGLAAYYNFNDEKDKIGFDMENDFYDIFHLNYRGAIKFSKYLIPVIERYNIEKRSHDTKLWQERADYLRQRMG
ncbi:MAG: hypothetical protein LBS21_13305 [Clostridiales bacterium]|nr:hypothetical protein [Clostridiales bacterium]